MFSKAEATEIFYLKACDRVEEFVVFSMTRKGSATPGQISNATYLSNDLVLISHRMVFFALRKMSSKFDKN